MLTFVGLGLYDERSITVEGRDAVREADRAFAEFYTSVLAGSTVESLEEYHGIEIEIHDRDGVERNPEPILETATTEDVVFLTGGDPMVSTTHADLRLRAVGRGIDTYVVHGTTAQTAASSLTGLQNYRFGKATTIPFEYGADAGVPGSVIETIDDNRERGLHTLAYLDIKAERGEYLTADRAAALLAAEYENVLAVAVARAGSAEPVIAADSFSSLADRDFGDPLHLLVIPGDLHALEADALRDLAGAPEDLLPAV